MTGSISLLFPVREPFSRGASAAVTRPSSPQHASRSQTPGATIAVATVHDDLLQRDYIIVRTTVRLYPFREDWEGWRYSFRWCSTGGVAIWVVVAAVVHLMVV